MAKRRRKNTASQSSNDNFALFCIFATVALYAYLRSYITSRIGLQGSAYLYSAYDFILIFFLLVPYGLQHTIERLIKGKLNAGQVANARRILYGGTTVALLYSIITVLNLLLFKNAICKIFMLDKGCSDAFMYLVPLIAASAFSSVYKGFLNGIRANGLYLLVELIEKLAMIIGAVIFCGVFNDYGQKVSTVVINKEYTYAFGAAGAAIGITFGYVIGLILSFVFYTLNKRVFNQKGQVKKVDDIYDVFGMIFSELIHNAGSLLFIYITIVSNQLIFIHSVKGELAKILLSYKWGAYCGVLANFIIFPVLWLFRYSLTRKHDLTVGVNSNNVSEVRVLTQELLLKALKIAIPFAIYVFVTAPKFINGLCLINSEYTFKIVRLGIFIVIPLSLAVVAINIVNGITKTAYTLINGVISTAASIVTTVLLVNVLKVGIYGVMIGFYIFCILFYALNYLSIKKIIKIKSGIMMLAVSVLIISVVGGVLTFLLSWLFGLFMPDALNALITFVVFVIFEFVAYCRFGLVSAYSVSQSPFAGLFNIIGYRFRLY